MQSSEGQSTCCRCNSTICCAIWTIISFITLAIAVIVAIGLATRGGGFSIGAVIVVFCLVALFIVFPTVGFIVFCCRAGISEASTVLTVVMFSVALAFMLAPFFYVIAAGLSIAEVRMGEGEDDDIVLGLALFAAILYITGAVVSIIMCAFSCLYVHRHNPARATKQDKRDEETLAKRKRELQQTQKKREEIWGRKIPS